MKRLVCFALLLFMGHAAAQGKAYRDINFSDSLLEVTQKVLDDETFLNQFGHPVRVDTTVPDKVLELQSQYVYIGGKQYEIQFEFYDDKLFRLRFYSDDFTANYFDTDVTALRDTLVETITTAHGHPDSEYSLSFFDMNSGRIVWSDLWNADEDGTAYKIGIGEEESTYYGAMSIEWTWLTKLYEANSQGDQRQDVSESADDF